MKSFINKIYLIGCYFLKKYFFDKIKFKFYQKKINPPPIL